MGTVSVRGHWCVTRAARADGPARRRGRSSLGRVLAGSWPPVRSAALPFDPWRVRSWRVLVHAWGGAAPRRTSIGLGALFEWSLDAPPGDGV